MLARGNGVKSLEEGGGELRTALRVAAVKENIVVIHDSDYEA